MFQLGMADMFTDSADLSGLLQSAEPLKVSEVVHKAFIKVDEAGSEAGAATGNPLVFHLPLVLAFDFNHS